MDIVDIHIEGIKPLYIDDLLKQLGEFALENEATAMNWQRDGGRATIIVEGKQDVKNERI